MKLREIAKLLRTAQDAASQTELDLTLTALTVPLVKAYAAKYGTDEQETMQELLNLLRESEPC
jgi:3-hydroxyisobutyrate dehydrogenase-like beta-hydroxyacid dehydrogenase